MTNNPNVPTETNPVVKVDGELRSVYLPPHSTDSGMAAMKELGDYGQAVVKIVAHGGPNGDRGLYWTEGQRLHVPDGTVVAHSLAEAAQLVKHLGWSTGRFIVWQKIDQHDPVKALVDASKELGFI
ncbi:hypothetical protein [Corynebacterium mucifaciens]|uniref:Uncharacterized protein n=1 Tax=Corynebacterium mucifaciens TaxID=57171 RepID=A0A7X6LTQ5_9CORY|nr:hypothetical protein [Corynebacterium mucifaciens]NKY69605.1 hypothetical protein [Corynebacterium mucifaciens]